VQALTGGGSNSNQDELQADCYAGLFASRDDGETARSVAAAEAFYRLGNDAYDSSRWFSPDEHGSPQQRFAAWSLGYLSLELGRAFCSGYATWEPGQTIAFGPYQFAELPGHPGTVNGDDRYSVAAEEFPTMTMQYIDIQPSDEATPASLLEAEMRGLYGADLGVLDGPFATERPDEAAFFYYAVTPDEDAGSYAEHGIVALQISPADPDHGVFIQVVADGTPPLEGEPSPELVDAARAAFQVAIMGTERLCAPHHTTEGDSGTHNEMCFDDL
jgi:hypothetical protein